MLDLLHRQPVARPPHDPGVVDDQDLEVPAGVDLDEGRLHRKQRYSGPRVVFLLRKLLIGVALAAIVVGVASSAAVGRSSPVSVSSSLLLPGVTYTREVDFTSRGPIVLDVVTVPKPDGKLYSLEPALSNDQLRATEPLTRLESRVAGGATTVAIDADYFDRATGAPSGIYMKDGVVDSTPAAGRSSLGVAADGTLDDGSRLVRRDLAGQRPAASPVAEHTGEVGEVLPLHAGVRCDDAA